MRLTCKPENRAMQQDVNRFGCARQYSTRKEISTCFLDRRCRLLIGFVFRLLHKLQKLVVALGAGAAQKFESTVENAREILRPAVPPPDLFALRPAFSHSVRQQTNINTLQSIATSFLTSIQFDLLNTTSNRKHLQMRSPPCKRWRIASRFFVPSKVNMSSCFLFIFFVITKCMST